MPNKRESACFKSISRERREILENSKDCKEFPGVGKYNNLPKKRILGGYIRK